MIIMPSVWISGDRGPVVVCYVAVLVFQQHLGAKSGVSGQGLRTDCTDNADKMEDHSKTDRSCTFSRTAATCQTPLQAYAHQLPTLAPCNLCGPRTLCNTPGTLCCTLCCTLCSTTKPVPLVKTTHIIVLFLSFRTPWLLYGFTHLCT